MTAPLLALAAGAGAVVAAASLWAVSGRDVDGERYVPSGPVLAGTAAAAGLVCALLAARLGPVAALPAVLYLAGTAIAMAVVDLAVLRLPDRLTLPAYGVVGALLAGAAVAGGQPGALLRALAGMAVLLAGHLVLALLRPGALGLGDVKLAGVLGLVLGWQGWSSLVAATFLSFGLATLAGLVLVAVRRADRRTLLPFGPALVAGALVAVAAGGPLVEAYLSVVGG